MTLFDERHEPKQLLARADGGDGPGIVLVGVSATSGARRALSYAAGFARRSGSTLALVHVCREPPQPTFLGAAEACALAFSMSQQEELRLLEQLAGQVQQEHGVKVWVTLRVGNPASEIARVACQVRADAVVVGSSHSFRRRILGGVPRRLSRRASWPVLMVP